MFRSSAIEFLSDSSSLRQAADVLDATEKVDPSYIGVVEDVLKLFPGLILCGADVAIDDATRPATAENYNIIELTTAPDLSAHHFPWRGQPRDVAGAIVDYLATTSDAGASAKVAAGSSGHCVVQALQARDIAYRYLSSDEITHPQFLRAPVVSFEIDSRKYYFASGFRTEHANGVKVPGPLIDVAVADLVGQKDRCGELLRNHGFSVPSGAAFKRESLNEAESYFESLLSCPNGACVKPVDGNLGQLVHLNVRDKEAFRAAFAAIAQKHKRVLVEEMAPERFTAFFCWLDRSSPFVSVGQQVWRGMAFRLLQISSSLNTRSDDSIQRTTTHISCIWDLANRRCLMNLE